jgi:hypothetical protein
MSPCEGAPNESDLQGNLAERRHKNRTAEGCFPGRPGDASAIHYSWRQKALAIFQNSAQAYPALDGGEGKNLMPSNLLKIFASGFASKIADLLWRASIIAIGLGSLAISPTSAADEQCHSIKSDKGRLACFDRGPPFVQSNREARPATEPKVGGAFVDPAEWLRDENDKVAARLKGICRGC